MKQTSIEWLVDQLTNVDRPNYTNKRILAISKNSLQEKRVNELVEQAKEIEKQQIINAYANGEDNIDNDGCSISKNGAESYFAETYESKESDDKFDVLKEMFELEQQLDIPSHMRWHNRTYSQKETLYTEEQVREAFHIGRLYKGREGDTNIQQYLQSLKQLKKD